MLGEFLSCSQKGDDRSPCNVFLGRAIKRVYGINDFQILGKPDTYLDANAIAAYLATNPKNWTPIGTASDQKNLDEAQFQANHGHAVVAVYSSPNHGHVCLVLPGSVQDSSTWQLRVPNSASFRLDKPADSYVGGPLSKAFGNDKRDEVKLYVHD